MRPALLTAVLILTASPAIAADPPRAKARAEAAAALALASSCDCPAGDTKSGRVAAVLAKVSADMAEEAARPAVAPAPREKAAPKCDGCGGKCLDCPACECPAAAAKVEPVSGSHSHTCPRCATTWSHTGRPGDDSHNCPRCGTFQNVVSGIATRAALGCASGNCAAPAGWVRASDGRLYQLAR
jgi:hypothetical protein